MDRILQDHLLWLNRDQGKQAQLQGADLQDANLRESTLNGAKLEGANLWESDLSGNLLRGANLKKLYQWGLVAICMALTACTPSKTGQKFSLYVSQLNKIMFSETVAEASAEARKQGTELLFGTLDDFLAKSVNDIITSLADGDALAMVAYEEDWSPKLESRLKAIQALLSGRDLRLGLWLLGRDGAPPLPSSLQDWAGPNFDAVSSASYEKPGKAMAKKFFGPLIEFRNS